MNVATVYPEDYSVHHQNDHNATNLQNESHVDDEEEEQEERAQGGTYTHFS